MRAQVVVLVLLAAAPAWGDEAKDHLEAGFKHYNAREWDLAVEAWKKAYVLDPDVNTLFAIGQAQRMKGDCESAAKTYRSVLRERLPKRQWEEVKRVLAICENAPDPEPPAAAPPAAAPAPAPAAAPAPAPVPPPAADTPFYTDPLGLSLAGLAAVSLATGGTFWLLASQAEDEANASPRYDDFGDA